MYHFFLLKLEMALAISIRMKFEPVCCIKDVIKSYILQLGLENDSKRFFLKFLNSDASGTFTSLAW